ncbi:MAG: hypothetical protein R3C15_18485 [Thermoleophilia bacterium]
MSRPAGAALIPEARRRVGRGPRRRRTGLALAAGLAALALLAGCGGGTSEPAPEPVSPPSLAATGAEAEPPPALTEAPADAPFRARLLVPPGDPAVGTRWTYAVEATDASGAPLAATVTVEVVDPLQQAHPVQYDATEEDIVDRPFAGRFEDYVDWPADGRGVPLLFRATVEHAGDEVVLALPVTPR